MKKMIKNISIALLAIAGGVVATNAQVNGDVEEGYLLTRHQMGLMQMLDLSHTNLSTYGTARSAAMGGAMTSLGADLSSMSINPAGLGMYRGLEFGITPSVVVTKAESSSPGGTLYENRSKFSIGNMGVAINVFEGTGNLTSATIGFGYNKLADYNYRSSAVMPRDQVSIAAVFQNQIRGVFEDDLLGDAPVNIWHNKNINVGQWGGAIAYKTFLIDTHDPNLYEDVYDIYSMDHNTMKSHYMHTDSRGSLGEYNISAGFNVKNKLYIGFTLGIHSFNNPQEITYSEQYTNNGAPIEERIDYMEYVQSVHTKGSGVNGKIGVIYRPIDNFRVGVAFHSPSRYSIDKSYGVSMYNELADGRKPNVFSDWTRSEYTMNTPGKLLVGASYIFAKRAILSVDYDRTWYNWMRLKIPGGSRSARGLESDYKRAIKENYKASNTVRVGAEFLLSKSVSVRGGYSYNGSFLKDFYDENGVKQRGEDAIYSSPVAYKNYSISGGLGFNLGRFFKIDLAYSYLNTSYTKYKMFYYEGQDNAGANVSIFEGDRNRGITMAQNKHNIFATFAFKF